MRDIVLTVFLFGSLPFVVRRPAYGIFLWVWVSIMNPHKMTWGFAYGLPFAQGIAIATLLGMLVTKEPKHLPLKPATIVLLILTVWINVTTAFAIDPVGSLTQWEKVLKIYFMVLVGIYLLHTRQHVQILIWIVTLSVAYFGIKGGLFTLRGGGVEKVYGPPGGYIEDNNGLALAVVMTIPLLYYLRQQAKNFWLRWGLLGSMVLCGFAALGSQSRGALLAISAMLVLLWLKSSNKVIAGLLLACLVPVAIGFMPSTWEKRMKTMETYEEDSSAMGRLNAWGMAINLTKDRPITGGGFEVYTSSVFARYAPNPLDLHAAHSIYFQMLGEHGYVGLCLFLLLWLFVWRDASWINKHARDRPQWKWASDLARMIQVSLVGYAVGGAFLNMAYFDVPYALMTAMVLTRVLMEKERMGEAAPFFRGQSRVASPPVASTPGPGGAPVVRSGQEPIARVSGGTWAGTGSRAHQPQINTDKHR